MLRYSVWLMRDRGMCYVWLVSIRTLPDRAYGIGGLGDQAPVINALMRVLGLNESSLESLVTGATDASGGVSDEAQRKQPASKGRRQGKTSAK